MPPPLATPTPSRRQLFFKFCQAYLQARPGGGLITDQASRLLLKHVRKYMKRLPVLMRNQDAITRRILRRFPHRRIDRDALEMYDLVDRDLEYTSSATGDEYGFRHILDEAIIKGEPRVLVEWNPTWEPVANVRKSALKEYRDKKRKKRAKRRRRERSDREAA